MVPVISFTTSDGLRYDFGAYPKLSLWPQAGGVYSFLTPPASGYNRWLLHYVGKTENLALRLPFHERWDEAARRGATHVGICVIRNDWQRSNVEAAMIRAFAPALNEQLKPSPYGSLLR